MLFDALGTKNAGITKPIKHIVYLRHLEFIIESAIKDINDLYAGTAGSNARTTIFSDSVFISTSFDSKSRAYNNLKDLSVVLANIFNQAIKREILWRGAVSYGNYFRSDKGNLLVGEPVNEVYEYEKKQQWIGMAACPSVQEIITSSETKSPFIKYDVPLTKGVDTKGYALDWFTPRNLERQTKTKQMLEAKLKQAEEADDVTVPLKIRNTLNFIAYLQSKT